MLTMSCKDNECQLWPQASRTIHMRHSKWGRQHGPENRFDMAGEKSRVKRPIFE